MGNCSVTGIFDKSMEHVGTKEIVPYQLYVPLLEGSLLEVLLYLLSEQQLSDSRWLLVQHLAPGCTRLAYIWKEGKS